jgi:hypothetical protein
LLVGLVCNKSFLIFFDERKASFREEESLIDGSIPNWFSPSIPNLLKEAAHSLKRKHPYDIPDRSIMRSILLSSIPGKGFQLSRFSPEEIVMHVWAEVAID